MQFIDRYPIIVTPKLADVEVKLKPQDARVRDLPGHIFQCRRVRLRDYQDG